MKLDELLKQNAAWLEQATKLRMFDKVDDKATNFPEEQRQRRMADLKARIGALSQRKEEVVASYDRAIELEEAELKALSAQKPVPAPRGVTARKVKASTRRPKK